MSAHNQTQQASSKITVQALRKMKETGERIAMLTAYDATFARLFDEAGCDILLVGDSAGMVVAGQATTLPVTMDETIYHCRAVARSAKRAQVVGDMPFMSYQAGEDEAQTGFPGGSDVAHGTASAGSDAGSDVGSTWGLPRRAATGQPGPGEARYDRAAA